MPNSYMLWMRQHKLWQNILHGTPFLVDALHERAADFYARREFQWLPAQLLRLYLAVAKVRSVFPPEDAP